MCRVGDRTRDRGAAIRAFLFDLDGVLWDSNRLHAEVVARTCDEFGLEMPDYARLAGVSTPEAFELVLSENGNPLGYTKTELSARKRSLFQERIDEVPSAHEELLAAMRQRRPSSLALVTGASRATAEAYLHRLPAGFFDLVITGEDGLRSKPAPDMYLEAARRLRVEPRECVVFEDSQAGIAAAREAGMRIAHITYAWGAECDRTCDSDWCAPTVLEALNMIWSDEWPR